MDSFAIFSFHRHAGVYPVLDTGQAKKYEEGLYSLQTTYGQLLNENLTTRARRTLEMIIEIVNVERDWEGTAVLERVKGLIGIYQAPS